ncbi:MAG: alpha/beta fold hydrolase [Lacisediminihabitans sp.]
MTESGRHADRGRRWFCTALLVTGIAASAVASAAAVLSLVMARAVVTPPSRRGEDIAILGVDSAEDTVTLSLTLDSAVPGQYGLWFSGDTGHARLGAIVRRTSHSVTRRVLGIDFGELSSATHARFSGWFYLSPHDLDYPSEDIEIPTALGPAPAWLIRSATGTDRWVIQVHGRAVTRAETLRAVPVFHEAGYTSLLMSYRNDGDAPASSDGRYGLGDTEWLDVESAIQLAVDRGARKIVLMGWSMGGATVLQTVTRSHLAERVSGVVLESPVVRWRDTFEFQARMLHLPRIIGVAAYAIVGRHWAGKITGLARPIDLDKLDVVRNAAGLTVPVLLMHSDDDGYVPSDASHLLAAARPDKVTMETFSIARHTKLWNYDPERWNRAITKWLAILRPE